MILRQMTYRVRMPETSKSTWSSVTQRVCLQEVSFGNTELNENGL
jgi:hypothetical protein